MGRGRGGGGGSGYSGSYYRETRDHYHHRSVETEDELVSAVLVFLADGPRDIQTLSSQFAVRFNAAVRSDPNTPYNPNKKNDGSFKKWLQWWGFEVSPTFERNRSMIQIPKGGLPWNPGGDAEEEDDEDVENEAPSKLSVAPFKAPHGMGSRDAARLAAEAVALIEARGPIDIGGLRQINDLGTRFNSLFFQRPRVNDGSWKRWLASIPNVEIVLDPARGHYHGNQPTLARIKALTKEEAAAAKQASEAAAQREAPAHEKEKPPAAAAAAARGGPPAADRAPPQDQSSAGSPVLAAHGVPMYVFLDATSVWRMLESEEGLLSFEGLISLCKQGQMRCSPMDERQAPSSMAPTPESERIIFVLTDLVLEELSSMASSAQSAGWRRERVEWLRTAADSYLLKCNQWGILEVLDTKIHKDVMQLTPKQEQRAREGGQISDRAVKMLDFAMLWESQVDVQGRVMFVTSNQILHRFATDVLAESGCKRSVTALLFDELKKCLASECHSGGNGAGNGRAISAASLTSLVKMGSIKSQDTDGRADQTDGRSETDVFRFELEYAMVLVMEARQLLTSTGHANVDERRSEVVTCMKRLEEAGATWEKLLSRSRPKHAGA